MSNRLFIEQMKRRGMGGIYVPSYADAAASAASPGSPITLAQSVSAPVEQAASALTPRPQLPAGVGTLLPQQQITAGPLGRNMTAEEATGHFLWKRHLTADGDNQLMPTSAGYPRRSLAVKRAPWLDLPAGGEAFMFPNIASVQLAAFPSTTIVVSFQVPKRKNGAIEWIANQFVGGGWTEGTGALIWQIRADGQPFKNFQNIIYSIGTTTNPADRRNSPIRIFENQVIDLVLINVSVIANQQYLLGMLAGKFWPIEQEGSSTWV